MRARVLSATLFGAVALATLQTPAIADGSDEGGSSWSATVAVTSDYRFRGQSQNSRDAALQGSVDYESGGGFFAGVWASMIDFSDTGDTDSDVEVDFYVGYNFSISENTEAGLKVTYYLYPNNPGDYEYWEFQGSLSHKIDRLTLSGEVNFSPDYFNGTGTAVALASGADYAVIENLSLNGHVGHQWIDDNALFDSDDYTYWDVGLTYSLWEHLTIDARYVDTDLSDAECFSGTDLCDAGFVGTLTLSLP